MKKLLLYLILVISISCNSSSEPPLLKGKCVVTDVSYIEYCIKSSRAGCVEWDSGYKYTITGENGLSFCILLDKPTLQVGDEMTINKSN
jgi:hypothetical protein